MKKSETEIIKAWITAHKAVYESPAYKVNSWAIDYLIELAYDKPEEPFNLINKILLTDHSEKTVLHLGAGPLQDLVNDYSHEYVDKISNLASISNYFRAALRNVIVDEECNNELFNLINSLKNNESLGLSA